jgi:hypothetical protein
VYQRRVHGRIHDFGWLEDRLLPLGFRLVFCTRRPESFAEARTERLKVSGNPAQYDDLQPFIDEQEQLRQLAEASRLPLLSIDVSTGSAADAVETIADWLEDTGGLTM